MDQNKNAQDQLLRLAQVEAKVGLKKTEIYRRMKLGEFPQSVKLGARAVAWPASAINTWIHSLVQQHGAKK